MINLLVLAAEAGEEGDPPNPVIPELNEVIWAAIFFFALWALMKYVLLPPIQRGMAAREEALQADRDAADAARADLGAAKRDYDAALADARAEATRILEEARSRADDRRQAIQAEVDAEIAAMRREAQAEIDAARTEAVRGLRGDVSSLAVVAAGSVLGRPLDAGAQQSVIDEALGS